MNKIYLIFLCFIPFLIFSQGKNIIEDATLECQYTYSLVKDTLNRSQINIDVYTLRIGKNVSQFYNQTYQDARSLTAGQVLLHLDKALSTGNYSSMPGAKTPVEYIYKNFSEKKITTTSILLIDPFQYEEDLEKQNWIIGDSIKKILEFTAQQAECNFRGRHWTAWFTSDIPISNGPWKLGGLPGLIIEAYDTNKDYHFTMISLKNKNLQPVTFYKISSKPFEKTDRKTFLKAKRKLWDSDNPNRDMEAATGIDLSGGKASPPREKKHNYEFIERDYR